MKIVYFADDGTQFDNEYDCEDYEWKLNHPHLKDVHIFDKDGNELKDVFAENTYHQSMKIIIPSIEALKDFQDFTNYAGYCAYYDIDQIGEWVFDNHKETFVMAK